MPENTLSEYYVYPYAIIPQQVHQSLGKETMLKIIKSAIKQNALCWRWPSGWDMTIRNSETNKIN